MLREKRIISTIIVPTLLVQLGITVGESFVPLYARNLGAPLAMAALVSALLFVGQAAADLPGGYLVQRFGERRVMLTGSLLMLAAMVLRISTKTLAPFVSSIVLAGIGTSFIWLARMSWLKKEVRGEQRGFVMSFIGGSLRMALILGPLIGGFVAEHFGYSVLFLIQGILQGSALIFVFMSMPQTETSGEGYRESVDHARDTWRQNHRTILAAVVGIGGLTVLRASRAILFPLWGAEMGLSESRVGIVMFVGAVVDASLFWLSGIIMTRLGRKSAAVMCTAGLAAAIGLLPLASTFPVLILLAVLAGLGNATGAGINLTMSNDLAPRVSPTVFLSIWRFVQGLAGFGGPALAAWMIRSAGSAAAPPVTAAVGFAGALIMVFFMKETRKPWSKTAADTGTN